MQIHSVEPSTSRQVLAWDFSASNLFLNRSSVANAPYSGTLFRQEGLFCIPSPQGKNNSAHSGTLLRVAHVPVRVVGWEGREGKLSGADRERRLRAPPPEKTDPRPEPARGARAWLAASRLSRSSGSRRRRHRPGERSGTRGPSAQPGPVRPGSVAREVRVPTVRLLPAGAAGDPQQWGRG